MDVAPRMNRRGKRSKSSKYQEISSPSQAQTKNTHSSVRHDDEHDPAVAEHGLGELVLCMCMDRSVVVQANGGGGGERGQGR